MTGAIIELTKTEGWDGQLPRHDIEALVAETEALCVRNADLKRVADAKPEDLNQELLDENEALRERVADIQTDADAWKTCMEAVQLNASEIAIVRDSYKAHAEAAEAHAAELTGALERARDLLAKLGYRVQGSPVFQTICATLAALPADALERARALNELETVCRNILPRIFRDTGKGSDVRSRVALENALANLDTPSRPTKEPTP